MRAPTIVRNGHEVMLVITKTVDQNKAPSVAFIEIIQNASFAEDKLVSPES